MMMSFSCGHAAEEIKALLKEIKRHKELKK